MGSNGDDKDKDSTAVPFSDGVQFIITGFGPFRDAQDNPTTTLANELVSYLSQGDCLLRRHLASLSKTIVLETSVECVTNKMDELFAEQQQQQRKASSSTITVLVHLGVHAMATQFQLETCAYNEADFRNPDEKGHQPRNQVIFPEYHLGQSLSTLLDVPRLVGELKHAATTESTFIDTIDMCSVSHDPGRFVCNYTYCYSLHLFQCAREVIPVAPTSPMRCLFVHVPPFEIIPKQQQLEFVATLLEVLYKQILIDMKQGD